MATAAQITANRANAQKSTGPRNTGNTRFNALKHGLRAESIVLPGEDPAAYERLAADYQRLCQPENVIDQFHTDTMIRCDWQKRRLQLLEAKLYRALIAEGSDPEELDVNVLRDSATGKLLQRVTSQIAALDRMYLRTLTDLRRMQSARLQNVIDACMALPVDMTELHRENCRRMAAATKPNPAPDTNPALRL